jgi:bifunctional oligoribonuclease and PAP phosphatase NrnA
MKQIMNPGQGAYSDLFPIDQLEIFRGTVLKSSKITIVTHFDPDGDAIGSSLALYHYLNKLGNFTIQVITPNVYPNFLHWMPAQAEVMIYENNPLAAEKFVSQSDLIFYVDFNTLSRLKKLQSVFMTTSATQILIDHHPNPNIPCLLRFSDTRPSSTSEIIYYFIQALGDLSYMNKEIAECLFTGIMTDTGCFSFNSSQPETWQVIAGLLRLNIDKDAIFSKVYENYSDSRMRLMGYCLNEKMNVLPDYNTAYISLSTEELNKFQFEPGDTEGFVNLPFSMTGIKVTALFMERDDHIKISLRSKGNIAINMIAEKHFHGGGHKNAAGGESKLNMADTISKFISLLAMYKTELLQTND